MRCEYLKRLSNKKFVDIKMNYIKVISAISCLISGGNIVRREKDDDD